MANRELTKLWLSHREEYILVIKNIPQKVTDETLHNYIEVISKVDVDHIYFHSPTNGEKVRQVALVHLKEKIDDISSVKEKAKKKPIEGQVVHIDLLNNPSGIIVFDIPREATQDEIELYFDRSQIAGVGAEVESCTLQEKVQIAVLFYKSLDSVLENIFKSPHKIRGKDLTVEPYYDAFHGEVIAALKGMETNGHHGHYLTMRERKSGYESMNIRKVEESVEIRKDNVGNRTSNSSIRILSADMTEYEDDEGYQMPLASGGGDERKDFEKQKPKKFTETTRSEHIYSEIYEEDLPLLPTTPRPSVKRSEMANEYKEKINMDKGKIILLKIRGFSKECAACQIDLNSDNHEITFIGSQDVVMAAKLYMYECLEESVEETKYVSKGFAAILEENSSWIKETLKKEKVHAYCTLKDDKKDANLLCCQAFSKPLAEKGIKTILSNLEKVELPYNEGHFKYVNSKEWTDLVSKLKNQNKVEVEMIKDKKLIVVSGKKGDFQTAKDLIKKELNKHTEAKSEKIEIKGSKSVCFDHGMKDKLEKIKSDISKRNGSLQYKHDPRKQTTVIELKGDSAIVEDKKAEISQLVALIWQGPVDIQKISNKGNDPAIMSRSLDSSGGRKFLSTFEEKHKCGIEIERKKDSTHDLHPVVHGAEKPDLQRRNTTPDFGGARPKQPQQDGHSNVRTYRIDQLEIILKEGNIVHERSSVLVNVVAAGHGNFNKSRITQAFMKKCGAEFEQKYFQAKKGEETTETRSVIFTDKSPGLKCREVCHLEIPKWTGDKSILYKAVRDCLQQCSIRKHNCVAFSAVGTGQLLKYPVHEVVNCLVSEAKVTAHDRKSKCITKIKFVIFDSVIVSAFKERLEKLSDSVIYDRHRHDNSPSDSKEVYGSKDGSDKPKLTVQAISVELFAVSKAEGEKIRKTLSTEIKDTFLNEDSIKNDKIKSLSTSTWKKIVAVKKGHVWIDRDNDKLTIKGEKDSVSKTKTEILEILLNDKTDSPSGKKDNHQNGQKAGGPHDYWLSKCDDADVPTYWKNFQGHMRQYAANFKGIFTGDTAKKVTIERDENMFKYIEQLVMKTWDNTKVGQGADAKNLNHSRIQVTKIQRIENYGLFDKYNTTKKKFYRDLARGRKYAALEHVTGGGKKLSSGPILTAQHSKKAGLDLASHANECYLFHGTSDQVVDNIINKGLDDRLGGDKAMFGRGIYAAESSTKADQYADNASNRQKNGRKMLLMRLLLGDMFVTSKPEKFVKPPCANCLKVDCVKGHHIPFDSVVADGKWMFREFIVYRSEQCYPEYLITYDRV